MIGYLEDIKNRLTTRLAEAVSAAGFACASGTADGAATGEKLCADWVQVRLVPVEKRDVRGVFTTNAPLLVQHRQTHCEGQSATDIARALKERLSLDGLPVARVAFAAPGFLNFYLADGWQQRALERILSESSPKTERIHTEPMDAAPTDTAIIVADWFRQLDFEIQYAYNRMCNQLELLADLGYQVHCVGEARFELLTAPQELRLMEHLADAPSTEGSAQVSEQMPIQASNRQYLSQLATLFHQFFNISPIRGEDREIAAARISLLQGCRLVFESVLKELFL